MLLDKLVMAVIVVAAGFFVNRKLEEVRSQASGALEDRKRQMEEGHKLMGLSEQIYQAGWNRCIAQMHREERSGDGEGGDMAGEDVKGFEREFEVEWASAALVFPDYLSRDADTMISDALGFYDACAKGFRHVGNWSRLSCVAQRRFTRRLRGVVEHQRLPETEPVDGARCPPEIPGEGP